MISIEQSRQVNLPLLVKIMTSLVTGKINKRAEKIELRFLPKKKLLSKKNEKRIIVRLKIRDEE